MNWTSKDVARKLADGTIKAVKDFTPTPPAKDKRKNRTLPKLPAQTPEGLLHIKNTLLIYKVPFVMELEFAPDRKFRFDIALPDKMVAIEYEGLMSAKSGHTTVGGYTKDAEKYNLAQALGWKVYRYTVLNYKQFNKDIKTIL